MIAFGERLLHNQLTPSMKSEPRNGKLAVHSSMVVGERAMWVQPRTLAPPTKRMGTWLYVSADDSNKQRTTDPGM